MPRYGITTLLDICPVGYEFTPDNTPLHLTHVDSFEVALNPEELASKLRQCLAGQRAFGVAALCDTFIGPNKDISVTILDLTAELVNLHKDIMGMLEAEGAILKNPQFHNESFEPHVSIYGDRRIVVGQAVQIQGVSIGIKTGEGEQAVHRILATLALGL